MKRSTGGVALAGFALLWSSTFSPHDLLAGSHSGDPTPSSRSSEPVRALATEPYRGPRGEADNVRDPLALRRWLWLFREKADLGREPPWLESSRDSSSETPEDMFSEPPREMRFFDSDADRLRDEGSPFWLELEEDRDLGDPGDARERVDFRQSHRLLVESLESGGWRVEWGTRIAADMKIHTGETYTESDTTLEIPAAAVSRYFGKRGFMRLGRFSPGGIAGGSTLDAVQGEVSLGANFKLGAVAGIRPGSESAESESLDSLAAAYLATQVGKRRELYHASSIGILGNLQDDEAERLALIFRQRIDLGPAITLRSKSEIDVDLLDANPRRELDLTQATLDATGQVTPDFKLRFGLQREKELSEVHEAGGDWMDEGTWKYWLGASQELPGNLELEGELAYVDEGDEEASLLDRWRVGLTRRGLPGLPKARVSARTVKLYDVNGYGASLAAEIPLLNDRLVIRPGVECRYVEAEEEEERRFQFTEVSVNLAWMRTQRLSLYAGLSYSFSDSNDDHTLVDVGLQYRW